MSAPVIPPEVKSYVDQEVAKLKAYVDAVVQKFSQDVVSGKKDVQTIIKEAENELGIIVRDVEGLFRPKPVPTA